MKPYRIMLMVLVIFTGTSHANVTSPMHLLNIDEFKNIAHKYDKFRSGQPNAISKTELQSYVEFIGMQYILITKIADNSKNNELVLPKLNLCINTNNSDTVDPEKIVDGVTNFFIEFTKRDVEVGNFFPLIAAATSVEHPCQ